MATRVFGRSPTYDDLRVPVTSTEVSGSNPPTKAIFATNGAGGEGYALTFDGSNDTATIPHDDSGATPVFDFASSWSLSFWAVISAGALPNTYLFGNSQWHIRTRPGSNLRVTLDSNGSYTTSPGYTAGQRSHFVLTIEESGGVINIKFYIDGSLVINDSTAGTLEADAGNDVYVGTLNGVTGFCAFVIDNIRFYDSVLDQDDVDDLYASGAGTQDAVQDGNTVSYYLLNEGSGVEAEDSKYTGVTTHIMDITGATWLTGLVESTGSQGVIAEYFAPGVEQELYFTVQLPHAWIDYDTIYPHLHFAPEDDTDGTITFGLEYLWVNINDVAGNTSITETSQVVSGDGRKHIYTNFTPINGGSKNASSMILCRLYRSASDTYAAGVYLWEIDFHYRFFPRGDISV